MSAPKIFLFTSHQITKEQESELIGISGGHGLLVSLPEKLQGRFSQVKSGTEWDLQLVKDLDFWLRSNSGSLDIAMIQGDFGVTFYLVSLCKILGVKAFYATTRRIVLNEEKQNGTVQKTQIFQHEGFREYLSPLAE